MTINIVIGTSWSGKKEFIKKQFPGSRVLSVGEYQRRLRKELDNELYVIIKANDTIMEDFTRMISEGMDIVMDHTLYKAERRKEYVKAIRKVTDEPIDIYLMQPSDKQIIENILADKERKGDLSYVKDQMRHIEIPDEEEGFAHVFIVNEENVQRCIKKVKTFNGNDTVSIKHDMGMKEYCQWLNKVVTHSPVYLDDNMYERVLVRIEEEIKGSFCIAEYKLPVISATKALGFTEEEMMDIDRFVTDNNRLLWEHARGIK